MNVGDSAAVITTPNSCEKLTNEHIPSNPSERQLLEAKNAYIHENK